MPMRPVWKLSDKRRKRCLKSGSGVLFRLLLQDKKREEMHSFTLRSSQCRYSTTGSHSPSQLFCCKVDADQIRLLCLPGGRMSIKVLLECWTWSLEPTHRATLSSTQHLSLAACVDRKKRRSITPGCTAKRKQQ